MVKGKAIVYTALFIFILGIVTLLLGYKPQAILLLISSILTGLVSDFIREYFTKLFKDEEKKSENNTSQKQSVYINGPNYGPINQKNSKK